MQVILVQVKVKTTTVNSQHGLTDVELINNLNRGMQWALTESLGGTKLGGVADTLDVTQGPRQTGEMGQKELHKMLQRGMQSPAPG